LRTYRLAVAATGEWTTLYGEGEVPKAQTAITTIINLVNAIYERDVAIHFMLVNNTNIIFTDDLTDPYASPNVADSATLAANQTTLDGAGLGAANYDIGHLFGVGDGFFSGLATLGVSCNAGTKARGVSAMNNMCGPGCSVPITNAGFVGGIAHEIGHQFSATHTFNATTAACGSGQRDAASAYEVGGGSTIMSYQVCGAENLQPNPDLFFHVRTLEQILNYATNTATCATDTATGNTAPAVTGPGNFTIPQDTPFTLTANATDTNGSLTYSWEQYDLGAAGPPNTDDGTRPIFRGYPPKESGSRTFPSLPYILNNANVPPATYEGGCLGNGGTVPCLTGESLPTTSRTLNFQVVVRDNQASGGGINTAASVLTVTDTAGPFAVTVPNGGGTLSGAQNVTWSLNNTNNAPVSCANVRITLSTDGGNTFPITLTASTPNTGTAAVVFPNGIATTQARVKVEAIGNIFFDISDANFTVVPADSCPAVSGISPKLGNIGDQLTITGINFMNSGNVTGVKFSNNVTATFNVVNDTTITTTVPAGAVGGAITVSKDACPDVQSEAFGICPSAPVSLSITDDTLDAISDFGDRAYYVNRLTPAGYPATLTQVSIQFGNIAPATPVNVVAGGNPGGTANIDGIVLQSSATTVGALNPYIAYTLPTPVTITSGDFVIGFQVPMRQGDPFPEQPGAADTDTLSPDRSYTSPDGKTFYPYLLDPGNFMIRAAQVFIGNCAGAAATPSPTPTATATPSATPTATPVPTPTPTPTSTPTPTPTPPPPTVLANISTRLLVGAGDDALIGGFIVTGTQDKKVIIRSIGPSLTLSGKLANPTLELRNSAGVLLKSNDDWKNSTPADKQAIIDSTIPPSNDLEAAIVATLPANNSAYTAIVRGANNTTGIGVVEVYDLGLSANSKLANISTRGLVQTGDTVLIAGTIVFGPSTQRVIIRAIGPSLTIAGKLANPTMELRDGNGGLIRANDDWRIGGQEAEIIATTIPPTDNLESAIVATLPGGASYTAVVRGVNDTTGIAVVEMYALD
jgi:hypothetical protein